MTYEVISWIAVVVAVAIFLFAIALRFKSTDAMVLRFFAEQAEWAHELEESLKRLSVRVNGTVDRFDSIDERIVNIIFRLDQYDKNLTDLAGISMDHSGDIKKLESMETKVGNLDRIAEIHVDKIKTLRLDVDHLMMPAASRSDNFPSKPARKKPSKTDSADASQKES